AAPTLLSPVRKTPRSSTDNTIDAGSGIRGALLSRSMMQTPARPPAVSRCSLPVGSPPSRTTTSSGPPSTAPARPPAPATECDIGATGPPGGCPRPGRAPGMAPGKGAREPGRPKPPPPAPTVEPNGPAPPGTKALAGGPNALPEAPNALP